jgi:hypothetical protein
MLATYTSLNCPSLQEMLASELVSAKTKLAEANERETDLKKVGS